ncbi:TetR/AcrR family transcriptional regulator [Rhodococcus opacus]|uniref:TetR/AcrR family transcriptional regulator n=1 Tax=Rhodococcus opacus TaxID=37919 RepID=UPI001C4897E2|nr:TetR family transcriptional regulator [Rhodococcus opacus]MBV6760440.1 TetR family transcriptional regulator [Rhodococcus opacus]
MGTSKQTTPSIANRIVREPTQRRSRETLDQIVAAAITILQRDGDSGFTIAKVAAEAKVSTGVLYSNFEGKTQLILAVKDLILGSVEESVSKAMSRGFESMDEAVYAYTSVIASELERDGRALRNLIFSPDEQQAARGGQAWTATRAALEAALEPFADEIAHPDPRKAIRIVSRTTTATLIHSTASLTPDDGISWQELAGELAAMTVNYLRSSSQ